MSLPASIASVITMAAHEFGVEPALLAAIARQESGFEPTAMRYEPNWKYMWDVELNAPFRGVLNPATFPAPDYVSSQTEWSAQRTSWGLCQVMGSVARENGYRGKFLSGLCDPLEGARYGAKVLARLVKKYDLGDAYASAVSAYNAGHPTPENQAHYVTPVLGFYRDFLAGGL